MLDVHPPHHPTHTWRDFFIHIATIVIGLLIAVGLEQTVEYIHHRHQVAEARDALHRERLMNAERFSVQTREFRRFVPKLKTNLAILLYLRDHPHAPATQWPGTFDWLFYSSAYINTAWTNAGQSSIASRFTPTELTEDAELAQRLSALTANVALRRTAIRDAQALWIQTPDPSQMSSQQIQQAIDHTTAALEYTYESATLQRAFATRFADFTNVPSEQDLATVLPSPSTNPESHKAFADIRDEILRFDKSVNAAESDSQ